LPAAKKFGNAVTVLVGVITALLLFFAATAPWRVAGRDLGRLSAVLGASILSMVLALTLTPRSRRLLRDQFLFGQLEVPPRAVAIGGLLTFLFLSLVVINRWRGFEVNAWDFSLYDRPLATPTEGGFLFNPVEERPLFATHAHFVLLPFLAAYALHPSPLWLLLAQSLAIAGATTLAFYCVRHLCSDDVVALLLALAFLLNDFTARAVQYVFHPEIFYPAALLVLVLGFLTRRWGVFLAGLLVTAAIKEDAVLPLAGFAATAIFVYKRRAWGLTALFVALAIFAVDTFVVLPSFGGGLGAPWYSHYWEKYGASPLTAGVGMLAHPVQLAKDLAGSGAWRLAGVFAFTPLLGYEWLLAAGAALIPYAAAQIGKVAQFRLYYSMPVLPLMLVASAAGVRRLAVLRERVKPASGRASQRIAAASVFLIGALVGPGYRFVRGQPVGVPQRLAGMAGDRPLVVQGSLFPHVGYATRHAVLKPPLAVDGHRAFLLAPETVPYPFDRSEIRIFAQALSRDPRYEIIEEERILLARPVRR
jgi:uncharacterized membrane protein